MSTIKKKELLNEVYGVVGISVIAKGVAGMPLNRLETLKGMAELAAAVAILSTAVKLAQDKKYIPVSPFSKST